MNKREMFINGMNGLIVGDAYGVPYEFSSRKKMLTKTTATKEMIGHGSHDVDKGTWSDDGAMALATLDSLAENGIDYDDIMERFSNWLYNGKYTTDGHVFDCGNTCHKAIVNHKKRPSMSAIECGPSDVMDNGNGSLMRILPACVYLVDAEDEEGAIEHICNISKITHGHIVSQMACIIYYYIVREIYRNNNRGKTELIHSAMNYAFARFEKMNIAPHYIDMFFKFKNLFKFIRSKDYTLCSSAYVIDTIESSIWAFLTSKDYASTIINVVNLGGDTDTTAAVAGGIASLYYGNGAIPEDWLNSIVNYDGVVKPILDKVS